VGAWLAAPIGLNIRTDMRPRGVIPMKEGGATDTPMGWDSLSILVTGGTGSFGKQFAEMALERLPIRRLIVLSRDEAKQQQMREKGFNDPRLRWFIGDVRDVNRLRRAMNGVDVVVHAAALKQVPTCEYNPIEAIMTNVMGARNVIDAALDTGVRRVMGLSTDKAVNPINLYGATKLCAEKLFVQSNSYAGGRATRFSCVRYGNVVGSRGSVIPRFMEQKKTGTLVLTDPRMTRFWITLEQGVDFVMRCIETMNGGEIFVPKIPSMRISDMAKTIAPECRIETVGIRPGEKLHEVLVNEDESRHTVEYRDRFLIVPQHHDWRPEGFPLPTGGKPCEDGFRYSSDTNTHWLTPEELQRTLELTLGEVK
jgi:UDP-N-acetylglucosamine 4,6-dehydratase